MAFPAAAAAAPIVAEAALPALASTAVPALSALAGSAAVPALSMAAMEAPAMAAIAPSFAEIAAPTMIAPMFGEAAATSSLAPALESLSMGPGSIGSVAEGGMGLGNSLAQMTNAAPAAASAAPMPTAAQVAQNGMTGSMAPNAGMPTSLAATPSAAPPQGSGIGNYMSKLADSLTNNAGQMALQGGVLAYQNNAAEEAQREREAIEAEAMQKIMAEGEKTNASVQEWASNYLSPEANARNTADAEATSLSKMMEKLSGSTTPLVAPNGAMSAEYINASADEAARLGQAKADYAKRLAALQAPSNAIQNMNFAGLIPARQAADSATAARSAGLSATSAMRNITLG